MSLCRHNKYLFAVTMRLTTLLVFFIATSACDFKQARADAERLASRVHRQIKAGDYKTLYNDSCAQLRKVATEAEFVGMMENLRSDYGALLNVDQDTFILRSDINLGRMYMLSYNVEFEHKKASERLVFISSEKGTMQLYELIFNPME